MFVNIQEYDSSKLRFYTTYIWKLYQQKMDIHVINQPQYVTLTKVNKQQTKKIVSIILEWLN